MMIYSVGFNHVWAEAGKRPKPRAPVRLDVYDENSVVAAKDAEEAITKVRKAHVGYVDEEDGQRVADIVIVEVKRVAELDIT